MRIAVLGAGAMGSLFGGYLSQENDVWLVDVDRLKIDQIASAGVTIRERAGDRVFHPHAVCETSRMGPMDLVIVFVKAMWSRVALEQNRHLIGPQTYVMSLQNGAGHEETLAQFVSPPRLVLGTTQHNSSLLAPGNIHHGGGGKTSIGLLDGDSTALEPIAEVFRRCGFDTVTAGDVKRQIWSKLFLNATASALTAILQVKLGYVAENEEAWSLCQQLIREAVSVADAEGCHFDVEAVISDVQGVLVRARDGITSICADIRDGRRTEVDTITGAVVRVANRLGSSVPKLEFVVATIHALEGRERS